MCLRRAKLAAVSNAQRIPIGDCLCHNLTVSSRDDSLWHAGTCSAPVPDSVAQPSKVSQTVPRHRPVPHPTSAA
jgi:hypothetical protein